MQFSIHEAGDQPDRFPYSQTVPGRFSIIFGSALMILEFINQIIKYTYELVTGKSFAEGGKAE